jgi:DNA adenine methylase
MVMRAILKYPGSKWRLARWIISHFPSHHSYLEPYFGSGAVLFNKPRSNIETVNDLDGDVVNLFRWIRRDPERLAYEVYYTPYSRQVYDEVFATEPESGLERAVSFYVRLQMGHGFRANEKAGWKNDVQGREKAYAARDWRTLPERILEAAERLREVQIERRPAVDLIRRFNYLNVLIYADPPYMLGTRHGRQYRCEMTDEDHEELLEALLSHRGPALISGYDNPLYNDRLRGWRREEAVSYTQATKRRIEVLWMNFDPEARREMTFE